MGKIVAFVLCVFLFPQFVHAKVNVSLSDTVSPVQVISGEELSRIPADRRSLEDIFKVIPSAQDTQFQRGDLNLAGINLRKNLVLLDGRRTDVNLSDMPTQMIENIEILKDGAASIYGSDAVSGVVNIITKKTFELHPQELPHLNAFKPIENQWLSAGVDVGRLGLYDNNHQFEYGLSTFNTKGWAWNPGWKLGETYGLSGPIVVLGKTPKGPGLSIFNTDGIFIGDVNKPVIEFDPVLTGKYLLRAEYPNIYSGDSNVGRIFDRNKFEPYGLAVFPQGRSFGDIFRAGEMLNYNLSEFRSYDNYLDDLDEEECVPPYSNELVYSRNVLDVIPNDPLYQQKATKKKGLITGVVGGLFNVGAGILGGGGGGIVDNEGPKVYDQYSLPQIGFLPTSDPTSAWNLVDANTKNVTVAVIDSGLDLSHPDGPQFVWTNVKEIPNNGIDDDKNGYIDDIHGWNFLEENNDLTDLRGHGTVVAGIIAARSNNGIGIAGINPGAVIMPLKVTDKYGNTNSLSIFRAIKYAVNQGAKIINVSLGAKNVSVLERLAINDARARGVLVVVASGNDGVDLTNFGPSTIGSALAVGAINFDGTRSTVSNWGVNNGLMAPGEEILSLQSKDAPWEGPAGSKERLYTKMSGTSFSTPMVAATASLLLVKNPNLTPNDLEDILESTAKHQDSYNWNARYGAGFLDAVNALQKVNDKHFNVKITGINKNIETKGKKLDSVDIYATVRGDVAHFTVEVGKGKHARSFKPIIGIAGQEAHDDLVAHISHKQLRGSDDWLVLIRAVDNVGQEHKAIIPLSLK